MKSDISGVSGWGAGVANESYMAPGHTATTVRGSFMRTESAGVNSGLSARKDFDSEYPAFPMYDNARDPATGNATARPEPYKGDSYSVDAKGHKMTIC